MGRQALLYILSGPDDFSLNQSLEEIKRDIGDQSILSAGTTVLDGQQLTLDQLRAVGESAPFLTGRRLVIIKGLLGRFEIRGRTSPQPKAARTGQTDGYKSFSAYLAKIPESTEVVLVDDDRIAANNPLLRELVNKAVVQSFPLLKDAKLRQWLQKRVAEEESSISPQAVALLMRLVGGNLWVMASEINKLARFASGRRIEEEDVRTVVSYAQQTNVFAMVDAIVDSKIELAERLLEQLLQSGASPAYLLVMLSRQMRLIVRARELRNQGKPRNEIQNKLGLTSDYALDKTLEQAGRYSWLRLKEVYQQLLEADLSIKTGKYDAELALNILVAELCQQGKIATTHSNL